MCWMGARARTQTRKPFVGRSAQCIGCSAPDTFRGRLAQNNWEKLDPQIGPTSWVGAAALATVAELTHSLKEFIQQRLPGGGKLDAPVKSIMTRDVRTCSPDDSLNVPAQIMWEVNCGAVPVLADGRALGMITDRDICIAGYTQGQPQIGCSVASANVETSLYL